MTKLQNYKMTTIKMTKTKQNKIKKKESNFTVSLEEHLHTALRTRQTSCCRALKVTPPTLKVTVRDSAA